MKRHFSTIFLAHLVLLTSQLTHAHRPIFSLHRAQTIWEGGIATENIFWYENYKRGDHLLFYQAQLWYGIKSYLTILMDIPYILRQRRCCRTATGFGDVGLTLKYRFYKDDQINQSTQASVLGGLTFPTSDRRDLPNFGSPATSLVGGLAGVYESMHWYLYGLGMYQVHLREGLFERGNVFRYGFAVAYRPTTVVAGVPDWAYLLEINGIHRSHDECNGCNRANTGGHVLWIGPSFGRAHGSTFLKGGFQVAADRDLNGTQVKRNWRAALNLTIEV